jgi:hypothetical protein
MTRRHDFAIATEQLSWKMKLAHRSEFFDLRI